MSKINKKIKKNIEVFISMPMEGKTIEQIKQEMFLIKNDIINKLGQDIFIIDSLINEDDKDIKIKGNCMAVWFLGKSIIKLASADLVFFAKGWKEARGCKIEMLIAKEYGKFCIEL